MPVAADNASQGEPDPVLSRNETVPIVVLGASAGGLEALFEFFDNLAPGVGMAFVLVLHQPARQISMLSELLAHHTSMPCLRVSAGTPILADHVYVSPPACALAIVGDVLVPGAPSVPGHRTRPIDETFAAVAHHHKERTVGIVLSGTGSDGSRGLETIKAMSGLTMAQSESSARYDDMPRNAIATKLVDVVAPAADLPRRLIEYADKAYRSEPGRDAEAPMLPAATDELLALLRERSGHDFTAYKRNLVHRRMHHRMNLAHFEDSYGYVEHCRHHPDELDALFQDLLIGVTGFFRDPGAYSALERLVVPELFVGKRDDQPIRVWSVGCATGEEPYSIAMLLLEHCERRGRSQPLQVLATDADPVAIADARRGVFPATIERDVGSARIERFFVREGKCVRVAPELRERVVFATHDVNSDPPFAHLDLIVCRNLLIYLEPGVQRRVLRTLHRVLSPGGYLFLGMGESTGETTDMYRVVDKRAHIHQRREVWPRREPAPPTARRTPPSPAPAAPNRDSAAPEVAEVLARMFAPPCVITDDAGIIRHVHGRTGLFLEPAEGAFTEPSVYAMARPGLQPQLGLAMREATLHPGDVVCRSVRVAIDGSTIPVQLGVRRLPDHAVMGGCFLVSFVQLADGTETAAAPADTKVAADAAQQIEELTQALTRETAGHDALRQDLEISNEELQSTNEEMHSINEELETSKEEMQSLNQELQTVNSEMTARIAELTEAKAQLESMMTMADLGILLLDHEVCIQRYTEKVRRFVRLLPADIGRPLADLVSAHQCGDLLALATRVLADHQTCQRQIVAPDGEHALLRIAPYRADSSSPPGLIVWFIAVGGSGSAPAAD